MSSFLLLNNPKIARILDVVRIHPRTGERIILLPLFKATKNVNYLVNHLSRCLHPRAGKLLNFQHFRLGFGFLVSAVTLDEPRTIRMDMGTGKQVFQFF